MDDDGNTVYRSKKTGECYRLVKEMVEHLEGSSLFERTPEQIEAWDRKKQQKQERVRNRDLNFYFVLSEDRREMLKPHTIARLFYLATYLHPDDSILRLDNGTPIKRAEMAGLLGLSDGTLDNFLKEVSGRYLYRQSDGSMALSSDFFRGSMKKHIGHGENNSYQKVFVKSLRELYRQTPVSRHRYLGYLFLLLPFVNWEYNVLCWNAEEPDIKKVNPMSISDFCREIGYDNNDGRNSGKLLNAYSKLRFTFRGKEMDVCSYLLNHATGKEYLVVNPDVLYRGHDRRKVRGFGVFFPQREKKDLTKT